MLAKNLKYYRLKNNMSKKDLAEAIGVSAMAITNYENGSRNPNMETLKRLASALNIRVTDFLASTGSALQFSHGRFRKGSRLSLGEQEYIRESVEEYFSRFFQVVDALGGTDVLGSIPTTRKIPWTENAEKAAENLRKYLNISEDGPIDRLVETLENKGVLVLFLSVESRFFSGMNGTVNGIPYIVINSSMSPARIRSTIVHEVAHFAIDWPDDLDEKSEEAIATAISGAFLFPQKDAYRELGYKRNFVSRDMSITCREYGISLFMLAKRARLCNIITESAERAFYIRASKIGWRANEPTWGIEKEEPGLFKQLVFRAVTEDEISIQKGAELLGCSYDSVVESCFI